MFQREEIDMTHTWRIFELIKNNGVHLHVTNMERAAGYWNHITYKIFKK